MNNTVLVSIAITPPSSTLAVGTTIPLTVTGTYADKTTADLTASAVFKSDTPAVATVATTGVATAVAAGGATISAQVNGIVGSAKITVTAATVTSIAVTPLSATTGVSGSVTYTATATLSDLSHQDVTSSGTWSSLNTAVATINTSGQAQGLGAGTTTIGFAFRGATSSATLTVTPATIVSIAVTPIAPQVGTGVTLPFQAIATYSDQSIADVTKSAVWQSSDPATVSLNGAVGTTLRAGTSIVTAAVGAVSGTTTVTVTPSPLQSIAIAPLNVTLAVGTTQQLKATGTYADGTTADLTASVTWTSDSSTIAFVSNAADSAGVVTGQGAGVSKIIASLGAVSGATTVTVTSVPLASITITPASPTIPLNTTVALTAKGTYTDGSVVTSLLGYLECRQHDHRDGQQRQGYERSDHGQEPWYHPGDRGPGRGHRIDDVVGQRGHPRVDRRHARKFDPRTRAQTSHGSDRQLQRRDRHRSRPTAVWATVDATIAAVSNAPGAQGQLTAVGAGSTQVSATLGGIAGSTTVTVSAPKLSQIVVSPIAPQTTTGQRPQFTATALYDNGTQQNVTARATWTSSNTGVATVNRTGQVTTVSPGSSVIQASFQGLSGASTLTVTTAVVTSITVTPISPSLAAGTTQPFAAVAIFSDNTSQDVTNQATWVSTSPAIAGVTTGGGGRPGGGGRGRVSALKEGTTQIQATWQGVTGSSTVTVTSAIPVSISVSPPDVTLAPGSTRQFAAAAIYSDGTSRDVTAQSTWSSSSAAVAGVTTGGGGPGGGGNRGLATAIAAGATTVTATFSGLSGTATITVTSAIISSIQVTPTTPTVAKGVPVRFTATVLYSDNTSQDVTATSTWLSSAPAVAGVSDSGGSRGQASTLSKGTATISATYKGITGSTTITVTDATLTTIQVTPFAPILPIGYVTQSQATGIYSDNSTQDLTLLATWISSAPAVVAVSDSGPTKGRVTPLSAGNANIQAVYQGVTGAVGVVVTSATLSTITVSPNATSIAVQASQQFTALGNFSDGSHLDLTTLATWFSSAAGSANVSNAPGTQGVAKGIAAGGATISAVRDDVTGTATVTVQ